MFLIIIIHKNATENSIGRKIDMCLSKFLSNEEENSVWKCTVTEATFAQCWWEMTWSHIDWGVPNNSAIAFTFYFFYFFFKNIAFEIVKACLGATVATCHSHC